MWCHLKGELSKGWEDCTVDRLLLLLAFRKREQSPLDKTFLKQNWTSLKIVGKKTFTHILHVLMKSVEQPQLVPQLLEGLVAELIRKKGDLELFWKNVGNPLVVSTLPRKHMGLGLFSQLLTYTDNLEQVSKMLFPDVARVICRTADHKDSQLEVCNKVKAQIVEKCRLQGESTGVLHIVKNFIQTAYKLNSTEFLQSATFSEIINELQKDEVLVFARVCMDAVLKKDSWNIGTGESKLNDKWSRTLASFLRQVAGMLVSCQSDFTCHILQFLLLHSFFSITKESADILHCQEVGVELSQAERAHCQTMFYRILSQLLSMRPEKVSKQQHVMNFIKLVTNLARYAQVLLESSENVKPVKAIGQEVHEQWHKIMEVVKEMDQKKTKKSSVEVLSSSHVFVLLILHLAFDLFTAPASAIELLQDIYVCREKALSKRTQKKMEDEGEPDWVEVMTEVLLSLLSRASQFARKTTVAVFWAFSSQLTPSALLLITEVLKNKKSKENGEEDLFEFEEMETEDEAAKTVNNTDKEKSDSDVESNEDISADESADDDDSDDDIEEGGVDEELRKSVKAALGPAAVNSDDDVEEEEDLSDSEMFQLDEQLAAAFKSMKRPTKKERKKKRVAITCFQLRALDLVEVVIKGEQCGSLGLELLEPLLQLVVLKVKPKGEGQQSGELQLCKRATELFHLLCKQRNLVDHIHTREEMLEVTQTLLQMAHTVNTPQLATEVANGCLFIMRLMTQPAATETSPIKTRGSCKTSELDNNTKHTSDEGQLAFLDIIKGALNEDFVIRRNPKINTAFYSSMIQKYPVVFWPLSEVLMKSLHNPDTKVHTKTQACAFLGSLLRLNKRETLSQSQWEAFVNAASPLFREVALLQQKENLKLGLMQEFLMALYHAAVMANEIEKQILLPADVMDHLTTLKSAFNKDTRCAHNKLTHLLYQAEHRKTKGQKRKRSVTNADSHQNSDSENRSVSV
ncbi:myb-binding protein 1A-like [Pomacea canaliculata]|uniref:myb-binding protein 1A-like n=1 Tax=Pomacea canaliculata TaxID=400727 RepID=UPI000D7266D4|nr:myb-binding protein 1A-like [Pomacea canaliculata]